MGSLIYCVRFFLFGLLVVASLFLLVVILSVSSNSSAYGVYSSSSTTALSSGLADSPNAVTRVMAQAGGWMQRSANSLESNAAGGLHPGSWGFRGIGSLMSNTGKGISRAGARVVNAVSGVGASIARLPGKMFGAVQAVSLSAVLQPRSHAALPTIEANLPLASPVSATNATARTVPPAMPPPLMQAQWPVHGRITTLFGVPELPYQPIHTGIDISDGSKSGVTPVHPFRPGKVAEAEHSGGLGNHVVIDHGEGMTSVYGHLASMSVYVGQQVDDNTVIGFEGSTGVSTGPHVHFEIRLNGQAVNPEQYVNGLP